MENKRLNPQINQNFYLFLYSTQNWTTLLVRQFKRETNSQDKIKMIQSQTLSKEYLQNLILDAWDKTKLKISQIQLQVSSSAV